MSRSYKGDVSVEECWSVLQSDPQSFLVDVRTSAEWNFVGFPLVPENGRDAVFAEWQNYPSMSVDAGFVERVGAAVRAAGGSQESAIFFLCRSGARSMSSAAAMTAAGFSACHNVLDGFEGPPDPDGHRGNLAGWKAAGLPWRQK
ncbi:rhodanese-like domain-containing protein [Aureimonas flava]|uniref:Rhodanese-like domain-containing protein n=1 Tax=Aureimonas flava TaxID=2320271 RepID=A0A3A1WIL9_9HYPH|nr:rhodanese-like domain-containing protein [Aureimonas flava]RIY00814.1 rhodanese-like domain-containing protein [Aureimonas flava]